MKINKLLSPFKLSYFEAYLNGINICCYILQIDWGKKHWLISIFSLYLNMLGGLKYRLTWHAMKILSWNSLFICQCQSTCPPIYVPVLSIGCHDMKKNSSTSFLSTWKWHVRFDKNITQIVAWCCSMHRYYNSCNFLQFCKKCMLISNRSSNPKKEYTGLDVVAIPLL